MESVWRTARGGPGPGNDPNGRRGPTADPSAVPGRPRGTGPGRPRPPCGRALGGGYGALLGSAVYSVALPWFGSIWAPVMVTSWLG